jgi:transcriptional regulator with XRE-family HTH domain
VRHIGLSDLDGSSGKSLLQTSTRGERLVEAMRVRGMHKQHALAHVLGVNESTVTRWKNDGAMSLESAIALCQALDVSLDWFLLGNGTMDRQGRRMDASMDDERLWSSFRKVGATMTAQSKSLLVAFINSIAQR